MKPISGTFAAFLGAQVVLLAILCVSIGIWSGWVATLPALLGGFVSLLNSIGLIFAWPRILEKKDVALAFGVIVSKFALSIGIVFWLTRPATKEWLRFQSGQALGASHEGGRTGLDLAGLFATNLVDNPIAVFAFGLAVVIPATVLAAWIESRASTDDASSDATLESSNDSNLERDQNL